MSKASQPWLTNALSHQLMVKADNYLHSEHSRMLSKPLLPFVNLCLIKI